jgi:hypothetical protein
MDYIPIVPAIGLGPLLVLDGPTQLQTPNEEIVECFKIGLLESIVRLSISPQHPAFPTRRLHNTHTFSGGLGSLHHGPWEAFAPPRGTTLATTGRTLSSNVISSSSSFWQKTAKLLLAIELPEPSTRRRGWLLDWVRQGVRVPAHPCVLSLSKGRHPLRHSHTRNNL